MGLKKMMMTCLHAPASSSSSASLSIETDRSPRDDEDDDDEESKEYGKKLVFLNVNNPTNIESFYVIDPSQLDLIQSDMDLRYSPIYQLPTKFLKSYHNYGFAVSDSTMYVIGGRVRRIRLHMLPRPSRLINPSQGPEFLNTMHVYDDNTSQWAQASSLLNVARANFHVFVIGKLIYVFGGFAARLDFHNWIECYDPDAKTWNPVSSNVPCYGSEFITNDLPMIGEITHSAALYERGSQVLFFYSDGYHTFDYVNNTWAFVNTRNDKILYRRVAVVEHTMFCAYGSTIYAYDLRKKMVVASHQFKEDDFSQKDFHLFRVGMKTLLLLYWDVRMIVKKENHERLDGDVRPYMKRGNRQRQDIINCCKFQIRNESLGSSGIRLFQDAHHVFVSQDGAGIIHSFVR